MNLFVRCYLRSVTEPRSYGLLKVQDGVGGTREVPDEGVYIWVNPVSKVIIEHQVKSDNVLIYSVDKIPHSVTYSMVPHVIHGNGQAVLSEKDLFAAIFPKEDRKKAAS